MRIRLHPRLLAVVGAALALPAAAVPATAAAPAEITPRGVGEVTLGAPFSELREAGLVGRMHPGCELAGPGTRAAALKRPLRGNVDLTRTGTPRVTNVSVVGGATARGVGVGDRMRDIRAAFPKVRVDRRVEDTIGVTLVRIGRRHGGRLEFALDATTRRVVIIGVPFIAICD